MIKIGNKKISSEKKEKTKEKIKKLDLPSKKKKSLSKKRIYEIKKKHKDVCSNYLLMESYQNESIKRLENFEGRDVNG